MPTNQPVGNIVSMQDDNYRLGSLLVLSAGHQLA